MFDRLKGRLLPALCILLGGCASIPTGVRDLDASAKAIELTDVPFYAQQRFQCGPAALATILDASGVAVDLDDLVRKTYVPQRKGSFQVELLAAARSSGRLPYRIDGTLAALYAELAAGRSVLVLQNLGVAALPMWHYAVVVGLDAANGDVVLRSGTTRRRVTAIDTFLQTWRRGDYWAVVALRPDELPASVERDRYFRGISSLEQAGRFAAAATAWRTALGVWPADTVALFGLANASLGAGDLAAAESGYRTLLDYDASAVAARNNLALVLAKQGRGAEALDEIERALAGSDDETLTAELERTRAEILSGVKPAN